ncbi:unnamed protein product [Ectocarpus sp. 8 AP-2014]
MLSLLTENKIASVGAVAMVTGVVLLLSASAVDTGPGDDDDGSTAQVANVRKKKSLLALGGSILSLGVLAQVYDQYTRFTSKGRSLSSSQYRSSSQMSPQELHRFQDRVSAAAAKLRKSIARTPDDGLTSSRLPQESAAELAARASAQISSFIQNYA